MVAGPFMQLVQYSWQLCALLYPYLLLGYTGLILYHGRPASVRNGIGQIVEMLPAVILDERRHIVYATIAGSLIAALEPSVSFLAPLTTVLIIGHGLATGEHSKTDTNRSHAEQAVTVIGLAAATVAAVTWIPLAQTITAVYILGTIFWKI